MGNNLRMHKHVRFENRGGKNFIRSGMCKLDQPEALCLTLWQLKVLCTTLLHYSLNSSIKLTI